MDIDKAHDVLGSNPKMSVTDIRKNFKRLVKENHPDHNGSDRSLREVVEAFECIQAERQNNNTQMSVEEFKNNCIKAAIKTLEGQKLKSDLDNLYKAMEENPKTAHKLTKILYASTTSVVIGTIGLIATDATMQALSSLFCMAGSAGAAGVAIKSIVMKDGFELLMDIEDIKHELIMMGSDLLNKSNPNNSNAPDNRDIESNVAIGLPSMA